MEHRQTRATIHEWTAILRPVHDGEVRNIASGHSPPSPQLQKRDTSKMQAQTEIFPVDCQLDIRTIEHYIYLDIPIILKFEIIFIVISVFCSNIEQY